MMRVNAVGWFLVAFFLIGGIAFWIAIPGILIGQIWTAVAVGLGLLYLWIGRRAQKAESLRAKGLPGTAQILEMTQTGVYINENPQVKFRLRVQAQGLQPYEVEKKATVPMIALGTLGSGRPLTVYVDPMDHEEMFIDWSGGGAPGAMMPGGVVPAGVPFTFSFEDGTTADISSDPNAQREVLDVLRANGLDPSSGSLDLRSNPRVREQVLATLKRHGYGPAGGAAAATPAAPAADSATERPGVDRLMELQQMKDKGLISDADFEETKDRILKEM